MKTILIALLPLLFFCQNHLFTQDIVATKTNYVILDSLINLSAGELNSKLQEKGIDTCALVISQHPAAPLIEQKLVRVSTSRIIFLKDTIFLPALKIWINNIGVVFDNCEDNETLVRTIKADLKATLTHKNGALEDLSLQNYTIRDTVERDRAAALQNTPYSFAKAEIPEPSRSLFDKIIEPAIVVSAAVVTVVLLFTVRSE